MTTTTAHALTTAVATADVHRWRRAALWGLLGTKLVAGWGTLWDIQWHIRIGRDSFWIAPHMMIYASVVLVLLIVFGTLARETLVARRYGATPDPRVVTILGVSGTRGFHLAALGILLTVLAAPVDDLWHRLFGIDVTIWSPPHLLGLAGVQINTLGCLLIARELWPSGSPARLLALLAGGSLFMAGFAIAVYPSGWFAYINGGVLYFTYPLLGAGLFALALVFTTQLARRRWTPIALVIGLILFQWSGALLAGVGFAILEPVPAVESLIRGDTTSPLAVAHTIAKQNGWTPGSSPAALRLILLGPAALMTLADPRRRWARASLVFAAGLMLVSGLSLSVQPAFQHVLPGPLHVVIALPLVFASGLLGGFSAEALRKAFDPGHA